MPDEPTGWTRFECDGHSFEYTVISGKYKERPAGWPTHKASPGPWAPVVTVVVRKLGEENGPGMMFPEGTQVTVTHAIETARRFWTDLVP
jgi:hypothetical protein